MLAVMLVALLKVTGPDAPSAAPPTLISGPKLAVVAAVQFVYWPVTLTATLAPAVPMLGLICVMTGVPAVTLKPPLRVTTSELVVTVMSRLPTEAFESPHILAVNWVVLFTVIGVFTVIQEPKVTLETPDWKEVNSPSMTTVADVPAWAEFGVAEVS